MSITGTLSTKHKAPYYMKNSGNYYVHDTGGNIGCDEYSIFRQHIWPEYTYNNNYRYTRLYISIKFTLYVDVESAAEVYDLCYTTSSYSGTTEKAYYDYCGAAIKAPITRAGGIGEANYEITNETVIKNILQYGFVLKPVASCSRMLYIEDISVAAYYYTSSSIPEIYPVTESDNESGWTLPELNVNIRGNVTWMQRIDRDLRLQWDFMQPFTTQAKYEIGVGDVADYTDTSKIKTILTGTTSTSLSIDRNLWRNMIKEDTAGNVAFLLWIRVTGANGSVSEWKFLQIHFVLHSVSLVYPENGTMWKGEKPNTAEWSVTVSDSYVSEFPNIIPNITGYAIYISADDGATYAEFAELLGEHTAYTFPENTMPAGKIIWKAVPLYDENNAESIFSVGSYVVVRVSANTSTVTCDGKPMPTVSWDSVAQASYQVRFGDYDSGAVYSTEKSHTVPYFFEDGVYEVTVRTQTTTGEWSEWSEPVYVQITNTPPGYGITVTAELSGYRVKVVWTKNSGYTNYIVYRDGVPIHVTDGGISTEGGYMDSMANGVSVYMVRGTTESGYYDQSAETTVNAAVQTDILFALGSDEILPLKYTPVFPRTYNYAAEMAVTYRYFAGRSKPVAITSGQISRTLPLSYIDKGRTLARKLLSYVGKTVVFKDSGGDMIVGVMNMANAGMGHVSTTSFQITEVDYNERVAYLPGE